jgi:hypothetical protein
LTTVTATWLAGAGSAFAQPSGAATPDIAKQVLNRRWQELKMPDATERNVLFLDVRSSGSNSFQVTAILRDYSPGFPLNHYYGKTCVARINQWVYKLWADGSGTWQVDGRMTPELSSQQCTPNPSAGVSSIPLQGLPGTPAPGGAVAGAPALPRSGGGIAVGSYVCWSNGQARMLLNFTASPGGRYVGTDGKAGTFSLDASSQRISFKGGALDGAMPAGFFAIYHEPQGRPTVSFRSERNSEAAFCQKQ